MKIKRLLVAVALSLSLACAFAGGASAAPAPRGPLVADCSAFRTLTASGWFDYPTYTTRTRIEQQYTPGGANCNAWREVVDVNPKTTINRTVYATFCKSGNCGFYNFTWPNYPMDNLHAYRFAAPFRDLTVSGTGCVWAAKGTIDDGIWAPYICV